MSTTRQLNKAGIAAAALAIADAEGFAWGWNDESLLLREVEGRAALCDGRRAHG